MGRTKSWVLRGFQKPGFFPLSIAQDAVFWTAFGNEGVTVLLQVTPDAVDRAVLMGSTSSASCPYHMCELGGNLARDNGPGVAGSRSRRLLGRVVETPGCRKGFRSKGWPALSGQDSGGGEADRDDQ